MAGMISPGADEVRGKGTVNLHDDRSRAEGDKPSGARREHKPLPDARQTTSYPYNCPVCGMRSKTVEGCCAALFAKPTEEDAARVLNLARHGWTANEIIDKTSLPRDFVYDRRRQALREVMREQGLASERNAAARLQEDRWRREGSEYFANMRTGQK